MAPKPAPSLASAYSKAAVKLSRSRRTNRVAPGAGAGDQQEGHDDALQAFLQADGAPPSDAAAPSIASIAVQMGADAVSRVFGTLRSGRASAAASPSPATPTEQQDDEPTPLPLLLEQQERLAPAPPQPSDSSEPSAVRRPTAEQQEPLPPVGPALQAEQQPPQPQPLEQPPLPQQPDLVADSSSAFTPRRAGGLYEALKQQQPAEVREQVELDEAYWDAEGLQVSRCAQG